MVNRAWLTNNSLQWKLNIFKFVVICFIVNILQQSNLCLTQIAIDEDLSKWYNYL